MFNDSNMVYKKKRDTNNTRTVDQHLYHEQHKEKAQDHEPLPHQELRSYNRLGINKWPSGTQKLELQPSSTHLLATMCQRKRGPLNPQLTVWYG